MTFIADSRKPGPQGGYWPLQHKDFDQQGYSVDTRVSRLAVRITGRLTAPGGQLGHYLYDKKSVGDMLGGMLWPKDTRPIPAWGFAFPAVITSVPPLGTSGGPKMRPIRTDDYLPDPRFEELEITEPSESEGCTSSSLTVGTIGVALVGTEETEQKNLFFPSGTSPHIAVNNSGDAQAGTFVADMKFDPVSGDPVIDPDRCARLQTMIRVVRPSSYDCGGLVIDNALAWNLAPTGLFGTTENVAGGGIVYDKGGKKGVILQIPTLGGPSVIQVVPTGSPDPITQGTLGLASARFSGPFEVGAPTGDQHKLGITADNEEINALHLSSNAYFYANEIQDGPLFFENILYPKVETGGPIRIRGHIAYDIAKTHSFICGDKVGVWRIYANGFIGDAVTDPTPLDPEIAADPPLKEWVPGQPVKNYAFSPMEIGMPATLYRPQSLIPRAPDLRNDSTAPRQVIDAMLDVAPIALRVEGFAGQGGVDGVGTHYGRNGDWRYTHKPNQAMFRGGTAQGGVAFMPPEIDMAHSIDDFSPAGILQSTVHVVALPGVFWGAGLPDTIEGLMHSGHRWGVNSDRDLQFDRVGQRSAGALTFTATFSLDEDGTTHVLEKLALHRVTITTTPYNIGNETTVFVDPDVPGTDIDVILPDATTVDEQTVYIKHIGSGPKKVNVTDIAGNRIDGSATQVLKKKDSIQVEADGTQWWIIG